MESLDGLWVSYADHYDVVKGKHNRDKSIHETDAGNFRKHIFPLLGKIQPQALTKNDVERLIKSVAEKDLSKGTQRHCAALLRRILKHGDIDIEFPAMPKSSGNTIEDLTPEQRTALIKVLQNSENRVIADAMLLIMTTGMRQGETRKLRWQHVDFHRSRITIKDPKGGKDGVIPMSDAAKSIIKRQIKGNVRPLPSGYVFNRNGKPLNKYSRAAKRLANQAGLPKEFRACHGLRHWYLTELAAAGTPIEVLRRLANHANISTTARYLSARDDQMIEATDFIGDMINA